MSVKNFYQIRLYANTRTARYQTLSCRFLAIQFNNTRGICK